tara:strand:+ start:3092 stop:4099 length:1008 start_codon:yes stop_codon:yes gene_type:complete
MPQVKEPLIRTLVKKALKEAEISAGDDNTKFNLKVLVSNPQSETKLGIRIQLTPSDGSFLFTEPDKKGKLEVALMKKMNNSLEQFDMQVSTDTDVSDPEAIGFFIPLSQIKNMIVKSLGGSGASEEEPKGPTSTDDMDQSPPQPKTPPIPKPPVPKPPVDDIEDEEELAEQDLSGMSRMTGLGMKKSLYKDEEGTEGVTTEELFTKVNELNELINDVFTKINDSDYNFKEYYKRNEEHIDRTAAIISLIRDELEDRVESGEPVGPDQGIEELKKVIKTQLNEMRQRDLNEISKVVVREDFYNFINAGNNVLRSLEEKGMHHGKKYLQYLVKHNIM